MPMFSIGKCNPVSLRQTIVCVVDKRAADSDSRRENEPWNVGAMFKEKERGEGEREREDERWRNTLKIFDDIKFRRSKLRFVENDRRGGR